MSTWCTNKCWKSWQRIECGTGFPIPSCRVTDRHRGVAQISNVGRETADELGGRTLFFALALHFFAVHPHAADVDEFKIKRQTVFEFAQKPSVTRNGDRIEIAFTTKVFAMPPIAIESDTADVETKRKIIRHLASGVLGANARRAVSEKCARTENRMQDPARDDQGNYVDDLSNVRVRVSLGRKPELERVLYYSPKKRIGEQAPLIQADANGVYVLRHTRPRSICAHSITTEITRAPFIRSPPTSSAKVEGLDWYDFPQGFKLPLKKSLYQQTLLTSGDNSSNEDKLGMDGTAASAMAVRNGRIALAKLKLNQLSTDGTTGGKSLSGPPDLFAVQEFSSPRRPPSWRPTSRPAAPRFRPTENGCTSPVTPGAIRTISIACTASRAWRSTATTDPQVFAGDMRSRRRKRAFRFHTGSDNAHFKCATSVDCDTQGRVYVSDYMNDRIQVFSPDGKFLQSIPVNKPALVRLHRKTNDIYVFSWVFCNKLLEGSKPPLRKFSPRITHFGPLEKSQTNRALRSAAAPL